MLLSEFYPYGGLISFGLTWTAIAYVLYSNPREHDKSISYHAAKNRKVYERFAVLMSTALFFLAIYTLGFLVPSLKLPVFITSLLVVAIILELLTTWIPLADDRKFHPHAVLSNGTAFLMPFITIGVIATSRLNAAGLGVAYAGLAVMTALVVVFFALPKARKTYLFYQSMYIVAFQLTIVLIPFLP